MQHRRSQRLERLLDAAQRVPVVDLLAEAVFGIQTWLLAAVGALAMVYFASLARRDWSVTELLLVALAAGIVVAAIAAALLFVWTLVREMLAQLRGAADVALSEPAVPERSFVDDRRVPRSAEAQGAPPPEPPRKKTYGAAELRNRLRALNELARQLQGPVRDAHRFGHAMATQIDEAFRSYSKAEIIDQFDIFRSFTEASLKDLTAIARRHSFDDIERIGPWDYGHIVDKTGVLTLLIPLVPEHVLQEDNFSAPALRQAGAEWVRAVDGFGSWISERERRIAAQLVEYETADVRELRYFSARADSRLDATTRAGAGVGRRAGALTPAHARCRARAACRRPVAGGDRRPA